MDEQRLKAYLNLIQQLLSCPSGEESDILNANRELVDAGLVQVMEQVADDLISQGDLDNANYLMNIAAHQLGVYSQHNSSIAATSNEYFDFLMQVLRAVAKNPTAEAVYPLLKQNQDKLDETLGQMLQAWAKAKLPEVELEQRQGIAADIGNFSNLMRDFPPGNRASNLEIAIVGYEVAAEAYTREVFPEQWATTQNELAIAYCQRILGDRAQNLEQAIAYCQKALQVRTHEAFPVDWAMTQHNLATAYSDRILGDRAQNLEQAITRYQKALQVYTCSAFPVQWATTQNNLANAYSDRILGDRAQNLEQAITCYQKALQARTREAFPVDWAMIQNNLGEGYRNRILGDRAQNLELAITCYQNALHLHTRSAFPVYWAATQNNLALAYSQRIRGDKAQNLEEAIAHYQNALQIRTRQAFPVDWAMTQNNLAGTYSDTILGDRAQNLEEAITCYQNALHVRTRSAFPVDWAKTQNNLGQAYRQRILGDRAQNLEQAIAYYQNALQVLTPTAFPFDCLKAGRNLGNLAFTEGNWQLAITGYEKAIAAVEQSRTWATNDERRQEILAESIDIYEKMVQACINNGQLDKAMEYAERSRSQRLVDLMAGKNLDAGGDIDPQVQEYLQQFVDKQKQIDQLRQGNNPSKERELAGSTRSRAKIEEENEVIQALEQEKQQIWQQIRQLDPVLSGQIQVAAPDLAAMQRLIDDDKTAILSFYTTTDNTHVFVLRKDGVSCHSCQGQGRNELQGWIFENWLKAYVSDKAAWRSNIGGVLAELAHRLRLSELVAEHLERIEELIIVPHLYLHQIPFGAMPLDCPPSPPRMGGTGIQSPPIVEGIGVQSPPELGDLGGKNDLCIHGSLQGRILSDQFLIRYVPSCQILDYCRNRPTVETPTEYGTVEDATEDLPCSSFEGEQIAQLYRIPENRRYRGRQNATVANYRQLAKQVQGILSTHHAQSRLDNPLHSELLLADGSITLGELLTPGWRLRQLVDVFLSCCETGLGLPETLTDDILTLSFGFLCAGARSVVSTLWAVDDLATALFSLFYHHNKQHLSRPAALKQAQEQLRTLSGETLATQYQPKLQPLLQEKLQQTIEAKKQAYGAYKQAKKQTPDTVENWKKELNRIDKTQEKLEKAIRRLESACNEPFPFSDYFYWSGFTCQGLR